MTKQRKKSTRQYRDREMVQDCDWEYIKIKRKLRIMTTDRARYSHEARQILKKQRTEIKSLKVANDNLNHTIWVTYGPQHLNTDIGSMRKLQTLLEAREDYERLCNIEKISCEELDIQILALKRELSAVKVVWYGEDAEREKRTAQQAVIKRLEDKVNWLTTNFCSTLHINQKLKDSLKASVNEKRIYQELYNAVTDKISIYKKKIVGMTEEASRNYEQRLEFLRKMKALNERSSKDEMMHNSEIKVLQRMIAHDGELKRFMSVKEHERLGHKADEVEKQAKMSVKEKAVKEEEEHIRKYEELFHNVKAVTGHEFLEKVVKEFTVNDEENFSRFDYVSELNHNVEKLYENIQKIKNGIKIAMMEDEKIQTGTNHTVNQIEVARAQFKTEVGSAKQRCDELEALLAVICVRIRSLFQKINSSMVLSKAPAVEGDMTSGNLKMYISLIEQRCMELICILKFIGLHQDHHKNLLSSPRSVHRIRPRGHSKILLEAVDRPVLPNVQAPSVSDELVDSILHTEEPITMPMKLSEIRSKVMEEMASNEAASLSQQPPFFQHRSEKLKLKKLNN